MKSVDRAGTLVQVNPLTPINVDMHQTTSGLKLPSFNMHESKT